MFVRLLGWLRNGPSAVVIEAYGGEVQGGSLLRITNQRGLLRFLGVEPAGRASLPEGGCGQKGYLTHTLPEDWVRQRHYCAPCTWGLRMMVYPCSDSDGPSLYLPAVTNWR